MVFMLMRSPTPSQSASAPIGSWIASGLARLRANPLAIQLPIGAEADCEGVGDLISMKTIYWDMSTQGMKFEYRDIPANLEDQAAEYRGKMIEAAAEANDTLMHKYLEH